MPCTWLIYALGGGLGHLQRGLSLARAGVRLGRTPILLTNSPWWNQDFSKAPWAAGVCLEVIPPEWKAGDCREQVSTMLGKHSGATLIVDTFPRGLGGDLVDLVVQHEGPRVLIHRDIHPDYWTRYSCHKAVEAYDLVLLPGEGGELLSSDVPAFGTTPWLLLDDTELLDPVAARTFLKAPPVDVPLGLLAHAGRPGEMQEFSTVWESLKQWNPRMHWMQVGPESASEPPVWPLLQALRGVDLLIGGGGYHTVHECRATQVPFLGIPLPRLYDRQALRLRNEERVQCPAHLVARLQAQWPGGLPPVMTREVPAYTNGVHAAARRIVEMELNRGA